jgi:putative peptidoglycan lipid II flippase
MPVKIGTAMVGLNLALNVAFMVPLQHLGPPLASSLASWCNVAALVFILRRRGYLAVDDELRRAAPRTLLAGLIMVGVLLALQRTMYAPLATTGVRWLGLGALIAGGLAAYGIAGQLLGAFDLREMIGGLRRRRARAL